MYYKIIFYFNNSYKNEFYIYKKPKQVCEFRSHLSLSCAYEEEPREPVIPDQNLDVALIFDSVDEIRKRNHSNERYWAVLSRGGVYYAVQGGSHPGVLTFEPVDEILKCDHSNEICWAADVEQTLRPREGWAYKHG